MSAGAAQNGDLSIRSKIDGFTGDYHRMMEGISRTSEAIVEPLHIAAQYIEWIGNGTIPALNRTIQSLNKILSSLAALLKK
jgi:hypothetical protein